MPASLVSPKSLTSAALILLTIILARSHRVPGLEQDESMRAVVAEGIRTFADRGDFNPHVTLERKGRVALELVELRLFRTGFTALVARVFGDEAAGYQAHGRYSSGGAERCMALEVDWVPRLQKFAARSQRRNSDRCEPLW